MLGYVQGYDERKFKSKTSDGQMKSTARKKQSQEETRTRRKSEGRREEMGKVRREKMHAQRGRKVAKHCVCPCFSNDL